MDMIIRNGTVVNATGSYRADVAVKDGKIAAVGCIPDMPGVKVVDAAGKLVLPGAIDAHTHLAMPFGGTVSSDDYFAGTRAAACGGTTTVFDFALQDFKPAAAYRDRASEDRPGGRSGQKHGGVSDIRQGTLCRLWKMLCILHGRRSPGNRGGR